MFCPIFNIEETHLSHSFQFSCLVVSNSLRPHGLQLFFGTLHLNGYIFPFLLGFHFSSFIAICKASSESHFDFIHFFFLGMVLIPVSYTMPQTSVHSSSGTLSIRSNLFTISYNGLFTTSYYRLFTHRHRQS